MQEYVVEGVAVASISKVIVAGSADEAFAKAKAEGCEIADIEEVSDFEPRSSEPFAKQRDTRIDPKREDSTRVIDGHLVYADGTTDPLDEPDE